MAEVTGLRNNALPYPIYGAPWGVVFPMLDADGDLVTGATTPDAERSLNGDTFADCTNESTEIATGSGMYYLLLTAAEMTADVVAVIAKSATAGMKTTAMTFYPRKLVTIHSGTAADDGSGTSTIVLDSGASAVDDFYNGMVCIATIDSNVEVRVISDYTGSTKTATVVPDWNVAVDNSDTFVIKLPEGVQLNQANASHWNSLATVALPLTPTTAGRTLDVSAGGEAGVDWANVGSPTTSLALTGTTIAVTQKVDVETIKTNPVANGGTVTFPTNATLASTTNITAGTIATVTNLTNAPTNGDLTATMKTSVTTAATAATPVAASVTGAVGSVAGNVDGNVAGSVGSVTAGVTLAASAVQAIWDALTSALTTAGSIGKLLVDNINATISSRLATAGYTAPDNTSITAIKTQTDKLTFTVANQLDANVQYVNDVALIGDGSATPWGPAP